MPIETNYLLLQESMTHKPRLSSGIQNFYQQRHLFHFNTILLIQYNYVFLNSFSVGKKYLIVNKIIQLSLLP